MTIRPVTTRLADMSAEETFKWLGDSFPNMGASSDKKGNVETHSLYFQKEGDEARTLEIHLNMYRAYGRGIFQAEYTDEETHHQQMLMDDIVLTVPDMAIRIRTLQRMFMLISAVEYPEELK
jgi:hypothetical protein